MKKTIMFVALVASAMAFAKDLVWNGGAGGTWSDTAEVWLDGATPCAWEDGATAVFSGSGLVEVVGEIKAGGIRFTSTGTALVGAGLIHLDGAVDAAAGTSNSISTRLYADPAMSKTGDGTVALAYTRGAFAINAGTVYAGGFNMLNTDVTVAQGAILKRASGGDKASNLVSNGSFETPSYNGYRYVSGSTVPTGWTRGSANYVVHMNDTAQKNSWGNTPATVPDGTMILAIQMNGEISQTVTVPADGFYDLSFYMYRRGGYNSHQLYLFMDGHFWQPFYDSLHSSQMMSNVVDTGAIWLSAGPHTITIAGEGFWGDTSTFIDDLVFAAPTLADAASIPSSAGVVVDVASGEQTFADTYSLTTDAHGYRRFAKTGAGKAVFTQNLAIGAATIYDVEGEAEYAGTLSGTSALHKRGTGALTLTTPGTPTFRLENGSLRVKNFTSSMTVAYRVDMGVTAGFYPGLASGDATIGSLNFAGNGTCALGTLGDGHVLTVTSGAEIYASTVIFDVGANDTIRFGNLRAQLVGNNREFVDSTIIKTGPGTLELTTAPTCYAPTGFTVREGTLTLDFKDTLYPFSYTPAGKPEVSTNTYGILRRADIPLVLGDRNSSATAAVALSLNYDGFTSPRPIQANAQPASVTLNVATGAVTLAGALTVNRAQLNLTGAAGTTLALGDVAAGTGATTLALDANLSLCLDGTVGAGVSVDAPAAAGINAKGHAVGTASFENLTLGGNATFDFGSDGNDALAVAGTFTLGTTAISLLDALDGSDFHVPGSYVLATYGTFSGNVSNLSVANPVAGYVYLFATENGQLTLTIGTEESNPVYTWTGSASGNWTDAANWDHASSPDGADKTVVFSWQAGGIAAALQGTATVGGIVSENPGGVTLSGGTITFSSSGTPEIHSKQGMLVITSAITGSGTVTVRTDDGAGVTIDGPISCDLLLDGAGVSLGTNAVLSGNVTVKRADAVTLVGGTAHDAVAHGLQGRYWHVGAKEPSQIPILDWKAFKALAERGTFVTEKMMDNAAGFLLDEVTYMNFPEELQGDTEDSNHWMGCWEGYLVIPAGGRHSFRFDCDDHTVLAIDGQNVTQCYYNHANSASLLLSAGAHRIFVGLYDISGKARVHLFVKTPSGVEQALPLAWLVPEIAATSFSGTGTLAPESVLTVAMTNGLSAWRGTLNGSGALAKTGASGFDTRLTAAGTLVAADGMLAATSSGAVDNVAVAPDATVALAAGGSVKSLFGGGTFAAGAHAYACRISCDADCGISSFKTYTHAINVCCDSYANGISPVATVNGVTFTSHNAARSSGRFASNIGAGLSGQPQSAYTDPQAGDAGLQLLLRTFAYNGKTNYVELSGLTPGKVYDFRAYYRPYGNSDRKFLHNFETGGRTVASITWDLNKDGGVSSGNPAITHGYSMVGCRYTAGADGKITLRTYKVNVSDTNGYHIYAFTNEELADSATDVTLAPTTEVAFDGCVKGDATVTVAGSAAQTFRGVIAAPLAVTGSVVLDGGASATGGVSVAQGGLLEMRPGATVGALTGTGTVRLAHGEHGLRGKLQADGTFAEPTFPQRIFFSGNDDCGISSGKSYVHAWNYGAPSTVWPTIVNGAQLAPCVGVATPYDSRRNVSMNNGFNSGRNSGSMPSATTTAFANTEIIDVLNGMVYGGGKSNEMNFVGGLTAGKDYELRFFNRAWDMSRPRQCIFAYDPFGTGEVRYDFNENDSATPSYIAFRIQSTGTSFRVIGYSNQSSDYPHFYGATIEEVRDYARAVDTDNDATFAGAVTGFGAFAKRGAGVLTLSGAVAATGPWTVTEGGLLLANAQASISNVAVQAGATFGGFGRVTGDLGVAAGGHLALGAQGTLQVGGNMVVAGGSSLDVAFNADGTGTGNLAVGGALSLPDDLTINLSGASKPATRRNLLTATGGITANVAGWTVNDADGNAIRKARINLDGTNLTLVLDAGTVIIFR